ncbi:MAG: chitobiase/beta-hexosaminidase C-terminal domain-containing protein [Verrucomicrobia bacterium]|nr:chitobiase/beta-hexosaminidase C-terminal domain-containing protein [Verrucomicrobiota bacterium]
MPHLGLAGMGNVDSVSVTGDTVTVQSGSDVLELQVCADGVLRMHFLPGGVSDNATEVLKPGGWSAVGATIDASGDPITLETSQMTVEVQRNPCRVSVYDAQGNFLIGEQAAEGLYGDGAKFDHRGDTDFYGIYGYGAFDGGTDIRRNGGGFAEAGVQGDSGAPLIWSRDGFGVLVDSDGVQFDAGSTTLDLYGVSRTSVELFILVGSPKEIMAGVGAVSGGSPMFPKWAMGFHNTEWGIDQAELTSIVNTYRSKQIPIDHYILDFDWKAWGEDNYGEWRWNTSKFPDGPSGTLMTNMLAKGIKLSGIMKPRIHVNTIQGSYATAQNLWWPGQSTYSDYFSGQPVKDLDFHKPEARDWFYTNSIAAFRTGILGWWNDEADAAGGGGASFDNFQFLNMQKSLYDGQRAITNQRVWSINRNFYLGAQRYAYALWSGDIGGDFGAMTAQRSKMIASLNVGQMKWGMDIGGFNGESSSEAYARWMQFGAFVPVYRVHGQQFRQRQPWEYGAQAEASAKQVMQLRYRLIPYIYAYERLAEETGVGVVRPLIWEYPDDPAVSGSFDAWMFGDAFLAHPVMQQGATSVSVYLPAGSWYDYYRGTAYDGPATISYDLDAAWTNFPLFIRRGAIIPMQPTMNYVGEIPATNQTLMVFPEFGGSSFTYYDDDGWTYAYETGSYFRQEFSAEDFGNRMEVSMGAPSGAYTPEVETWMVRVYCETATSVHVDGAALPFVATPALLEQEAGEAWTLTEDRFGVAAMLRIHAGTAKTMVISNNLIAPPSITPAGGTYDTPVLVVLSTNEPGSEIRYTTDGSDPTELSPLYSGPILIGQDATVKARAFLTGKSPSRLVQAVYTFANNLISNPGFETGGTIDDVAVHWYDGQPDTHGGTTGNSIRENWGGYNSTWHGVVRGTWSGQNYGSIWQEVPAIPGANYSLTAWFWADSHWSADEQGMKLEFLNGGSVVGGTTNLFGASIGPAWVDRTLAAQAPGNAEWVRVTFYGNGTHDGALRIDDVTLETDGQRTLLVESAHGAPVPSVGAHTYQVGDVITNSVASPVLNGIEAYVCTGWSLVGHEPQSGSGTNVTMTITNSAILTWLWETNVLDPCTLGFATSDVSVSETAGVVSLTVLRGQSSNGLASVRYHTEPISAVAGQDYVTTTGLLQIAALETAAQLEITLIDDLVYEGDESFRVVLTQPSSNAELIVPTSVVVTIQNDDPDLGTRTLTVASAHGQATPAAGAHVFAYGSVVAASVDGLETLDTTQYVGVGWSGTGAVPASGSGTSVSLLLTNNSEVTWLWNTNVKVTALSAGNGSVLPATAAWVALGTATQIVATPASGFAFSSWTGDVPLGMETNNPLTLAMERARTVTAIFAPLPDANLLRNPSFEDELPSDELIPLYWWKGAPDQHGELWGSAARVNWRPLSGGFHGAIRGAYAGAGNFGGFWQEVPAVEDGVYTFSTWVYADTWFWASTRLMKIEFLDGADGGSNILQTTQLQMPLNEFWQEISVTATAPVGATWARVVLDVSAIDYGGAIQFEDLELRLLSGPVTHLVTLGAGAHGAISPSGAVWVANGANLEIAVTADAYYHIDEISLPPLVLFPTNPVHVTFLLSAVTNSQSVSATFAEDVTSDVPHWWLAQYHAGTNFTAMVVEDLDGDGFSGAEEYVALTDPSASNEYLRLDTSVAALTPGQVSLSWQADPARRYDLEWAPGMGETFAVLESNLTASPVLAPLSETNQVQQYRIRARIPE